MENKKQPPKLIHEYSVEELLNMMGTATPENPEQIKEKTEEEKIDNQVIKFLLYYDIKPGTQRISSKTLFRLFKSWNKDTSFKYSQFLKDMFSSLQLRHTTQDFKTISYFKLNKSLTNIVRFIEEAKPKKILFRRTMNYKKFMEEFLAEHNLKAGNIFVEADILYYLFDFHNSKKGRRMIGYERFVSMCHLYFPDKQLGFGSTWFGVDESIKAMITPEWIKTWRQGRVKYGHLVKEKSKEKRSSLYLQKGLKEETQLQKILYSETLPKKEPKEQD